MLNGSEKQLDMRMYWVNFTLLKTWVNFANVNILNTRMLRN